jgi:dTDP-4-amino-4,6-dideoxygalactose transaminase
MDKTIPFLDLNPHHAAIRAELDQAIKEVIDSNAFAGGPFVEKFERDFASYCGARYAVGVGSGTEALWLSLLAGGVGTGDEVITVANTFMATAEAVTYCGARPVFVDVNESTYTMDPAGLEDALGPRTKAIIPVHLFGQPADMDPILEFARKNNLLVIEDAAQAHGAKYKGRTAGTLGDAGCFSFYPSKNLGALGEAGAIVTDNAELQEKLRILRDHGQVRKYCHDLIGWNCRMDGIQAAVLRVKLRHLESGNSLRRAHALRYNRAFDGMGEVAIPFEAPYARHVYHVYAIRVPERDVVMNSLKERGIQCAVHYPIAIHLQKAYQNLGYKTGSLPVSERIARELMSLPMFPELTETQMAAVVCGVREAMVAGAIG